MPREQFLGSQLTLATARRGSGEGEGVVQSAKTSITNRYFLSLARSLARCVCARTHAHTRVCVCVCARAHYPLPAVTSVPGVESRPIRLSHSSALAFPREKTRARARRTRARERESPALCRGSFGPHIPRLKSNASFFLSPPIFSSLLFSLVSFSLARAGARNHGWMGKRALCRRSAPRFAVCISSTTQCPGCQMKTHRKIFCEDRMLGFYLT